VRTITSILPTLGKEEGARSKFVCVKQQNTSPHNSELVRVARRVIGLSGAERGQFRTASRTSECLSDNTPRSAGNSESDR